MMSKTIFSQFDGKRILITGATGFKGSWLSVWLNTLGAKVLTFSNDYPTEPSMYKLCRIEEKVQHVLGDVRDYTHLSNTVDAFRPEYVFHLAAQPLVRKSYREPRETFETNMMGTLNLVECCRISTAIKSIIVVTTDKCYKNEERDYGYVETDPLGGVDPYSASKAGAEIIAHAYLESFYKNTDMGLATVRAGNVIGGGDWAEDRLIPDFVRAYHSGDDLIIRHPEATRPWQFVLEPLAGYLELSLHLAEAPEKYSGAWNFGPEESSVLTVGEVLNLCKKILGDSNIIREENVVCHEAGKLQLSIEKAKEKLAWKPIFDSESMIRLTMEWYKAYYTGSEDITSLTRKQIEDYMAEAKAKGVRYFE